MTASNYDNPTTVQTASNTASSNVVSITGSRPAPSAEPTPENPEMVALLEGLLRKARDGSLKGVAVAAALENGKVTTGWAAGSHVFQVLAAVTVLNGRIASIAASCDA
jgi:hypothetical protein